MTPMHPIEFHLGQLRHLYSHMVNGRLGKPEDAARGLLGPAIEAIEREYAMGLHRDADAQLAEDKREEESQRMRDLQPHIPLS